MKKIALFVSDIEGTLTHYLFPKEEYNKSYMQLPELLELIRVKYGCDEVMFSLSTSGPDSILREYAEKLAPYFEGTKIKFGNQYSGRNSYDENFEPIDEDSSLEKVDKIVAQINNLKNDYEVAWVGVADDILCRNSEMHDKIKENFNDIEVKTFCPIEIVFLASLLSDYLNIPLEQIDKNLPSEYLDFDYVAQK